MLYDTEKPIDLNKSPRTISSKKCDKAHLPKTTKIRSQGLFYQTTLTAQAQSSETRPTLESFFLNIA